MTTTTTYTVSGMTCGHCAASVTEEVSEVPGVTGAADDAAVRAAVEEAGYAVTS